MFVGTSRCDVEVPGPREEGPSGASPARAVATRPAARPQPAGSRPARPEETRGPVRPAGRRSPAALPPVRPRVAGGGVHAPVAAPSVATPAVLRRRRVAAVLVLGALLGVLVGVLVGLVVPDAAAPTVPVPAGTSVAVVGAGESLDDVAGRVAPGADTGAVVARIRELNGLEGSAVATGRPLVVPGSSSLAG
ncbi:LysM peptidoglycan-binding domain-containing protein [Actinomycetospora sp. C-140]